MWEPTAGCMFECPSGTLTAPAHPGKRVQAHKARTLAVLRAILAREAALGRLAQEVEDLILAAGDDARDSGSGRDSRRQSRLQSAQTEAHLKIAVVDYQIETLKVRTCMVESGRGGAVVIFCGRSRAATPSLFRAFPRLVPPCHPASRLQVVASIRRWRSGLTREFPFMWRGQNYLRKIGTDVDFLSAANVRPFMVSAVLDFLLA